MRFANLDLDELQIGELAHAADVEALERRILEAAMQTTGARHGAVFSWATRGETLRVDANVVDGVEVGLPGILIRRRSDDGPHGVAFHVAEHGVPHLTNDTSRDPYYADYMLDSYLTVRSIAAAPILYQRRAIGVIAVSSADRDAFTQQDLRSVEEIAGASAVFLRRAQLYRRTQHSGRRPALIKGLSPAWLRVERLIERVSAADVPVLICGESGTGKELVANAIHFNSQRADKPFVSVNCAAIPEPLLESTLFGHVAGAFTGALRAKVGDFEKADGGTLFLDEVGELSSAIQAKLLRAIELGEVQPLGSNSAPVIRDVRVLAATNRDLELMRRSGTFRDDLFFRLAVVTITVPPLRSFLNNLEILCRVFLTQANQRYGREVRGLTAEAFERLRSHRFPGNMRELRNLVDHAVLVSDAPLIGTDDLPLSSTPTPAGVESTAPRKPLTELRRSWVAQHERPYLVDLLDDLDGNVRAAAEALSVDRTTLYRLLKKHGIRLSRRVDG